MHAAKSYENRLHMACPQGSADDISPETPRHTCQSGQNPQHGPQKRDEDEGPQGLSLTAAGNAERGSHLASLPDLFYRVNRAPTR